MDINVLQKQLQLIDKNDNINEIIENIENVRKSIIKEIAKTDNENERILLDKCFKLYTIKLYENKIKVASNVEREFYYRGKLIKILKEYEKTALNNEKNIVRNKIDGEILKHKELSKEIRMSKKDSIKINESLGLMISEISDTIELFLSKHDLINKFKETCKSTLFGGAFTIGIEALVTLIMGSGISSALLINSLPIIGFIGISNLVRNLFNKSSYQKYIYKNSKEYQDLIKKIPDDFKEEYEVIRNLIKEKENADIYNKTSINKQLTELYDKIINSTKVDELKKALKIEKQNVLLENKKLYEDMIEKHIKDQAILSKKQYQEIVREKLKNDIIIFENENSIKEASTEAVKKSGLDVVCLVVSRIIAGALIPGYAFTSIKDLLIPLGFLLSNNLIGIINYKDKLVNSKYNNKKVIINNKEKFEELAKVNNDLKLAI